MEALSGESCEPHTMWCMLRDSSRHFVRAALIALLAGITGSGCMRIQSAQPLVASQAEVRQVPTQESATTGLWPARWAGEGSMGVIVPVEGPLSSWRGMRLGPEHYLRGGPDEQEDAALLAASTRAESGYRYILEGPGSFIFQRQREGRARVTDSNPAAMFKFVSARPALEFQGMPVVMLERSWLAYYDSAAEQPRGLIALAPGLFGVPEPVIDRFVELCRADGWAVLRLLAPPSRFTERITFSIDRNNLDASARTIAAELGQRAAETAYAIEAGVRHVHTLRPGLADGTHVLIGMSGGAMASSTILARNAPRFDAAVFIAGGANFLMINEESNYAPWVEAMTFEYGEPALTSREKRAIFDEVATRYLENAPLDGHHLAESIRGIPILMLHGTNDRAVPSRYGDQLWEKLGKPERWVYQVGHELMFMTLNAQTPRVLRWLRQQEFDRGEEQ